MEENQAIENLLDPCWLDFKQSSFVVEDADKAILIAKRQDLGILLGYIDAYLNDAVDSTILDLYRSRLDAMTEGTFSEQGKNKVGIPKYIGDFNNLIDKCNSGSFSLDYKPIPIDRSGFLIDGAHRAACAIFFDLPLKVCRLMDIDLSWEIDTAWMLDRGMRSWEVDYSVNFCLKQIEDLKAFIFWPRVNQDVLDLKNLGVLFEGHLFGPYVVSRRFSLDTLHLFTTNLYLDHDWIGTPKEGFPGALEKAREVYGKGLCHIVYVRGMSNEDIIKIKKEIREHYNLGFNSVHSTDNNTETCRVIDFVTPTSGISKIVGMEPFRYKESLNRVLEFRTKLRDLDVSLDNFLIDGSTVLAMYGIRNAQDLDYIYLTPNQNFSNDLKTLGFDSHNEFLELTGEEIKLLSTNRKLQVRLFDMVFFTLEGVKSMKLRKMSDPKSVTDIELIDRKLRQSKSSLRHFIIRKKSDYRILNRKIKKTIIINFFKMLRFLRIYNVLKFLYNKFK